MTDDRARFRQNLNDELDGVALYTALADAETDPVRKDLFRQLAHGEAEHAEIWRGKLRELGIEADDSKPGWRSRAIGELAKRFGPGFVLPTVAAAEAADQNKYAGQADAAALAADEHGHAAVIQTALGKTGGVTGAEIAKSEKWHRGAASGNDLRAAVLGANDGLVSNFCLLMGVAGSGAAGKSVLLTGIAGLAAGACSMALGEWLSVTNARELARTQIDREAQELEQTPESEQKELALIYQAKGLDKAEAQQLAANLMKNKDMALDTLAREELGIDPAELGGNPWTAAGTSFLLFAAGAFFPTIPFAFLSGAPAIAASTGLSAVALAAVGVATSLFNGRGALFSAARQVVIGIAAAAVTYGVGALAGVELS